MKRKKTLKRIALVSLLTPFILMSFSGNQAYAMKSVDDYEKSLLLQMDFNQNTFADSVSHSTFSPSVNKGQFIEGIKYNSFSFDGNQIDIPLSKIKADKESLLTLSFWWYPENVGGSQEIVSLGNYHLDYNGSTKSFDLKTGNTTIQKASKTITPAKWVHVSLTLSNQNMQDNKLFLDGKGVAFSTDAGTSSPYWSSSSTLNIGSPTLSKGSRIDEIELRKGVFSGTDAEDLSRLAQVPDLHGEVISGNPHLSWSNDIMPENVLVESSFEEGQMVPRMGWGWVNYSDGGQEIVNTGAYGGDRAMKITDTLKNGNHYNYPNTSSNTSISVWDRLYLPNGTNLSVTYYAKAENDKASIMQSGDGSWGNNFSSTPPIFLTKPLKKGERVIHVDDLSIYKTGSHIGFDTDKDVVGTQYQIESTDAEAKTITLRANVSRDYAIGQPITSRVWRGAFSFGSRTVAGTGEWQRLSQNTKVNDYDDYDVFVRGGSFMTRFTTGGILHLDNLKLGYATKTKLYRDNQLLYEGFLSDYRDTASKDTTAPSTISDEKVTRTRSSIQASFSPAIDKGNKYAYRIQAVTNDGKGTPLSKEVNVEVIAGIKGYSYVLDSSPKTIPNNTVNTSTPSISLPVSDSNLKYLHVKAIDQAGNAGETVHIKVPSPDLQVKPDKTGTYAELNWSMDLDKEPFDYKVYKRTKGTTEFQSVSTFNQDEGKELKVLNLYPTIYRISGTNTVIPSQTFKTWKGETKTLPKSASLEKWMEEPNEENPKGYGKGLIDVVSVDYDSFNENPMKYLQKNGDEWNFDSIFFGTWDANAYQPDFSDAGLQLVTSFVGDGNGLLVGHDVVRTGYSTDGFQRLNSLLNVGIFSEIGSTPLQPNWATSGKVVRLKKSGLMTKYPWDIGEIGSTLNIPATHTLTQVTYGDVWIDFANEPSKTDKYGKGEANFYLTTWNNTGMIQTGHSKGEATTDEQKILSNTLFYLSQKTSATSLNDYSSVDDKKPDSVPSLAFKRIDSGVYDISFPSVKDNGTTYEYYVEAVGRESRSVYQSSIKEATILSGMKGYRVDVTARGEEPISSSVMSTTSPIRISVPNSTMKDEPTFTIHVKAIDHAGNFSMYSKELDSATSYLIVSPSTTGWTNQPVVLSVKGSQALGRIEEIYLPNGSIVKGESTTYRVTQNGKYPFYARDEFGQWIAGGWTVENIDTIAPIISTPTLPQDWVNKDVEAVIEAE